MPIKVKQARDLWGEGTGCEGEGAVGSASLLPAHGELDTWDGRRKEGLGRKSLGLQGSFRKALAKPEESPLAKVVFRSPQVREDRLRPLLYSVTETAQESIA